MCWRKSLWTIALCFGLGLGLGPAVRSAHACSCVELMGWGLMLEQITGEGDPTVEEAFWSSQAAIYDWYFTNNAPTADDYVLLRRVQ